MIRGYAPTHLVEVREFLTLLGLQLPADMSSDIVLPVYLALEGKRSGGIGFVARSTYDLISILSASIDVPDRHAGSGLAITYPSVGVAGKNISRRVSEKRPKTASVAVNYRGSWFYIDETDQTTKLMFRLMKTFWTVRLADSAKHLQTAPLLTVPVSK